MAIDFRTIKPRRGTAAEWAEVPNYVLDVGELSVENDTGIIKIGNGATVYSALQGHLPENLIQALINSAVGPLVTAALASSSTVADAAAAAADQAIADGGLVTGASVIPAGYEDVALAITSETNERSWLEISSVDGGPTDYAKSILEALFETVGAASAFETSKLFTEVVGSAPNRDIFVTDADTGSRVAIATAGDNYEPVALSDPYDNTEGVVAFTNVTSGTTAKRYWRRSSGLVRPISADPLRYVAWGDSLTYRGGMVAALAAKMPDVTVVNKGIGSQRSDEIFARQGGLVPKVTAPIVIPASGSVAVPVDITFAWNDSLDVTIGGVAGVMASPLADAAKPHTFTRTGTGSTVNIAANTPIVVTQATTYENDTAIFWPGRNDVTQGKSAQFVLDNIEAGIDRLRTLYKRVLVISVTQSTLETVGTTKYNVIKTINDALRVKKGIRFADVQSYLVDNAPAIAASIGITLTSDDLAKIAGDTLPPSFVPVDDILHHTPAIQTVIGNYLFDSHIQPLGWHS